MLTGMTASRGSLRPEEIAIIAQGFGLGQVQVTEFLPAGLMNENWRIVSDRGTFAVKRVLDSSAGDMRSNLSVMLTLAVRGLPVCAPLSSAAGDLVLDLGVATYCATPWITGRQPHGLELSTGEARALGTLLGRLHLELAELHDVLPMRGQRPVASVGDPDTALTEADRFASLARRAKRATEFDSAVVEFAEQRKILLEKHAHLRPNSTSPLGPFGWTHGDFQHLNLIWAEQAVVAVLDWDRVRVRPWGEEVARSATLLFGHEDGWLDLARVAAFAAGYRAATAISREALADAIERLWWKRMCDYWHLEFHYDRGDSSCDHLFLSASRFLGWWTEQRDDVRAAFATA